MPDFPASLAIPQTTQVSSFGETALPADTAVSQNVFASAGATWPAANRALYIGVWVEQPLTARKLWCFPTTASGNLDMGIYDSLGTRIVSKGSTAVGTANAVQVIDITASVTGTASPVLVPGTYFIAMSCSNTTAAFRSAAPLAELCRISGVQQEALGSVTLGGTATFANPASAYVPSIGIFGGTVL